MTKNRSPEPGRYSVHTLLAIIAGAVVLLAAAPVPIEQNQVARSSEFGPVALTVAAASRTFTIPVKGRSEVTVYIQYTDTGAGAVTAVTMTCLAGPDSDIVYPLTKLKDTVTDGESASDQHKWVWTLTTTQAIRWVVTPLNDENLKCEVDSVGTPNAGDIITSVKTRLGVL